MEGNVSTCAGVGSEADGAEDGGGGGGVVEGGNGYEGGSIAQVGHDTYLQAVFGLGLLEIEGEFEAVDVNVDFWHGVDAALVEDEGVVAAVGVGGVVVDHWFVGIGDGNVLMSEGPAGRLSKGLGFGGGSVGVEVVGIGEVGDGDAALLCAYIQYPLPVGITVYTLQTMSYVIDVYHGRQKAARNLLEYAGFVTMFPQLSAGPIVNYHDMEESLRSRRMNLRQISMGAKRICVGLAKKVLIADAAGRLWEDVMTRQSSQMSVAMAWLGIIAFAFQIYFSFSGYADMAIGLGNCMGFNLPENFDHPYVATSVTDFFRRWNITLVKWMKIYFFKPLAGEKKSLLLQIFWVFASWGLIGLWYGPDWTFVLWGLWLALFYVLEKLFLGKLLEFFPAILRWAYAMLVVAIGWLFFALDDVADAWVYLQVAFGVGARGLMNHEFLFLAIQYLPTILLGTFFSLPIADAAVKKLEQGKNGMSIALTRFLEKVYPGVLLLISLVYLVGRGF